MNQKARIAELEQAIGTDARSAAAVLADRALKQALEELSDDALSALVKALDVADDPGDLPEAVSVIARVVELLQGLVPWSD